MNPKWLIEIPAVYTRKSSTKLRVVFLKGVAYVGDGVHKSYLEVFGTGQGKGRSESGVEQFINASSLKYRFDFPWLPSGFLSFQTAIKLNRGYTTHPPWVV